MLACFSAIHNHGFEMLLSFSAIVQHTPWPPIGFSILRAGLLKSVILSVYTRASGESQETNFSHGITHPRLKISDNACFDLLSAMNISALNLLHTHTQQVTYFCFDHNNWNKIIKDLIGCIFV